MMKRLVFIFSVVFVVFISTKASVGASNLNEETMINNMDIFIRLSEQENYTETDELVQLDMIGEAYEQHEVNTPYSDPGVEMVGGDQTGYRVETTSTLDETKLGIYTIVYDLYNELDSLVDTLERTIEVVDTTPPEIILSGDEKSTAELGEYYVQVGGSCSDNYDNSCKVFMQGLVDTSKVWIYTLLYTATDSSGNNTAIYRTVTVVDTTAPVLTLKSAITTIPVGQPFEDPGITIEEFTETSLTTNSDLDVSKAGRYTIEYIVTDAYGNVSTITRVIHVYEPTPKIDFYLNPALTSIEVGSTYQDPGCTATINGETFNCSIEENTADTAISGVYTITYSVDYNGETYTHNRYIFVYDVNDNGVQTLYYRKEEEVGVIL